MRKSILIILSVAVFIAGLLLVSCQKQEEPAAQAPGYDKAKAPGYGEKAPGYGEKAPGYGEKAPGYGQKAPGYGEKAPGYGEKAPGYGDK